MTSDADRRREQRFPVSIGSPEPSTTFADVAAGALRRIRRDPVLLVPFAFAGVLVALADVIRRLDPLPAARPDWIGRTVNLEYSVFPTGTARTTRDVGALVDLETPYLIGAIGLELAVVLAVALAGWVTITRAMRVDRTRRSVAAYVGTSLGLGLVVSALGAPSVTVHSLPVGLALLVVAALVLVHLFLLPGFLAVGMDPLTALRRSVRGAQGRGWTLLGFVVALGLAYWVLALVPIAGGFLSTALVGPVHAVVLAVLLRHSGGGDHNEGGAVEDGHQKAVGRARKRETSPGPARLEPESGE